MKRAVLIKGSLLVIIMLVFMVGPALATKPSETVNPNGFPSGPHHNLNIIAKPAHFSCPPQEYYLEITSVCGDHNIGDLVKSCPEGCECEETGIPIYGNVIFVPREQGGNPITILMESGRKGPKGKTDATELEVVDWCTESFPDDGGTPPPLGDSAVLRLPKNDEGYAVYARITGKPGELPEEPTFTIYPDLSYVEDEAGNDLLLIGLVTSDGVYQWVNDEWTLYRTDANSKGKGGKGVQKADNITGLFLWSGSVCYLDPLAYGEYCLDEDGNPILDEDGNPVCSQECWCCVDTTDPPDGLYDRCDPGSFIDSTCVCPEEGYCEGSLCYPYVPEILWCREYTEHWIFNIADFVGYLWNIDTTGAYVVQVRFYPLPLKQ